MEDISETHIQCVRSHRVIERGWTETQTLQMLLWFNTGGVRR